LTEKNKLAGFETKKSNDKVSSLTTGAKNTIESQQVLVANSRTFNIRSNSKERIRALRPRSQKGHRAGSSGPDQNSRLHSGSQASQHPVNKSIEDNLVGQRSNSHSIQHQRQNFSHVAQVQQKDQNDFLRHMIRVGQKGGNNNIKIDQQNISVKAAASIEHKKVRANYEELRKVLQNSAKA
jgi:hypothetical protein